MKRNSILALSLSFLLLVLAAGAARGQDAIQVAHLISVLRSDSSVEEKEGACAELKRRDAKEAIPALAALLTDPELSHCARYVLEPMPGREAGEALLGALPKTLGSNEVGVINSLAVRGQTDAVEPLGLLLTDKDAAVAVAAAEALGRIGGGKAMEELEGAAGSSSGAVREAEIDGELAVANKLLTGGEKAAARENFQRIFDGEKNDAVRAAAFRGLILSSDQRGIKMLSDAIAGTDGTTQGEALLLASTLKVPAVTKALVALLPRVLAPVQIALLQCLDQRADPIAMSAVARLVDSPDSDVQLAAITALGDLGDGSVGLLLAQKAASTTGAERTAARESLVELRGDKVTGDLVADVDGADANARLELVRALGDRGDQAAIPELAKLIRDGDDSTRAASYQAMALVAGAGEIPEMVRIVIDSKSDDARSEAADALDIVYQRIESKTGHADAGPIADAVRSGPVEARLILLPVCAGLNEEPARAALRVALEDGNAQVRDAAVSAVCDSQDVELLPDMLRLAEGEKFRLMAVRGCVRLMTQEETVKVPVSVKVPTFKTILGAPLDDAEKRLVLSGLGTIADVQALAMALPMLDDAGVRPEASRAVTDIAMAIYATSPREAKEAFEKVLSTSDSADLKKEARAGLRNIDEMTEFITVWEIAGPYEQAGKNFAALFDTVFPPEEAGSDSVKWQAIPAGTDAAAPWKLDLLLALGGQQRVAYARTWIYSPSEQPARIDLGSDDGNKVWINGQLVHSNNASRALQRDSDKFDVTLRAGWNPVLLKITQNTAGWSFCMRVVGQDGKQLPDVRASVVR